MLHIWIKSMNYEVLALKRTCDPEKGNLCGYWLEDDTLKELKKSKR